MTAPLRFRRWKRIAKCSFLIVLVLVFPTLALTQHLTVELLSQGLSLWLDASDKVQSSASMVGFAFGVKTQTE